MNIEVEIGLFWEGPLRLITKESKEAENIQGAIPPVLDLGSHDPDYLDVSDFVMLKYRFIELSAEERRQLESSGFFRDYEREQFFEARMAPAAES